MSDLTDWTDRAASELGLGDVLDDVAIATILDLARDAAHNVARPAAPLTTFLLGLAVGRGMDRDTVAAQLTALALAQD